jgi:hypothetical protein
MNHHQIIIHLLTEDLKSSKFLHTLEGLGLDSSSYTLDLASLILKLAGFEDPDDSLYEWYVADCEKHLKKIELLDPSNVYKDQAFDFYVDLLVEKRMREKVSLG